VLSHSAHLLAVLLDPGTTGVKFGQGMLKVSRPEQHRYDFKATGCRLRAEGQGQAQQICWSFQAL
jgi:hypothetical protein